jgi:DNA polymerase (family X)
MKQISPDVLYNVIEIFKEMSLYYKLTNDKIREKAYLNAVNALMEKFLDRNYDLQDVLFKTEYIGRRLSLHILNIMRTGTYYEYEKFRNDPKLKSMMELQNVYGIGPAIANRLYKKGITSLQQLKKIKDTMPMAVQHGIKYHKELNQVIPNKVIAKFDKTIKKIAGVAILCGSARRGGSPTDLDYLLIKPIPDEFVDKILANGYKLKAMLAHGSEKIMAIFQDEKNNTIFKVDIRIVDEKSKDSALLYFTGPKLFNIWMRQRAIEQGLILNEYGLFKGTKPIELNSEKDIFKTLKVKYLSPEQRTQFWLYI